MPSPEFTLRPAVLADAPAIRAVTREAYAKWVPLIGREPLPMTADHEAAVRRHRVDLLCRGDGAVVALIEMVPAADHLLIENVAVAPAFQGRGLGRRLLGHAEQVARALGHARIRLYTNGRFAANLALYRHLGYGIEREEAFRGGGVVVHMAKPLPPG